MEPQLPVVGGAGEFGLTLRKLTQTLIQLPDARRARYPLRKAEVQLEVARLAALKIRVEPRQSLRQAHRKQSEALTRARLDERARDQQIDFAPGLRSAQ
jgi:hypothetical protein